MRSLRAGRRLFWPGYSCGPPYTILRHGAKCAALAFQRGLLAGQPLPALDHYVDIFGIEIQSVTDALRHFRRGESSAAAQKRVIYQFANLGVVQDRSEEHTSDLQS